MDHITKHLGNLDPMSKFVHVRKAPAAVALQVFIVGNIIGCTQVIPVIATSSNTGDGQSKRRISNSHIDLATCHNVSN
jgi:hypothetical protein